MIIKHTFKDHLKHKNKILNLIEQVPDIPMNLPGDKIAKTDWLLTANYKRDYWEYLWPLLDFMIQDINQRTNGHMKVINCWFQQYKKGHFHSWHNHVGAHFSSVYYLELPKGASATELYNTGIDLSDVKEGDILTFPGHIFHRSPPVSSNKRKTSIVFNTNIHPLEAGGHNEGMYK